MDKTVKTGEVLLPEATPEHLTEILMVIVSQLSGASAVAIARAHAALEGKHAAGFRKGREIGARDGYQLGYSEGLADGRLEALDETAKELAERATLKAAARSRK